MQTILLLPHRHQRRGEARCLFVHRQLQRFLAVSFVKRGHGRKDSKSTNSSKSRPWLRCSPWNVRFNPSIKWNNFVHDEVNYGFLTESIQHCVVHHKHHKAADRHVEGLKLIDCKSRRVVPAVSGGTYVALSYVGCATSSPSKQDQNGRLELLPPLFDDAIKVTLELGQRYLWVDRYCIDQNNPDERSHQIRNMATIFRRSWVTIVSLASGVDQGLPRVSGVQKPCKRVRHPQCDITRLNGHLEDIVQQSDWMTRCWTFQEAILSPRLLIFSYTEASLACDRQSVFESAARFGTRTQQVLNGVLPKAALVNIDENPISRFRSAIEAYCSKDLSRESDSFDAFKGCLATSKICSYWAVPVFRPQRRTKGWTHFDPEEAGFLYGLTWRSGQLEYQPRLGDNNSVPTSTGFPSWSWISARPGVNYGTCNMTGDFYAPEGMLAMAEVWLPGSEEDRQRAGDVLRQKHPDSMIPERSTDLYISSRACFFSTGWPIQNASSSVSLDWPPARTSQHTDYSYYPDYKSSVKMNEQGSLKAILLFSFIDFYGSPEHRMSTGGWVSIWLVVCPTENQVYHRIGLLRCKLEGKGESREKRNEMMEKQLSSDWSEGEHCTIHLR